MEDCIFCKIVEGLVPSKKVYEDELTLAFYDVAPQTPIHVLIVPKTHVPGLNQASNLPDEVLARLFRVATSIAADLGLKERGYRLVSNCGIDACQSVPHLHMHLSGGRAMGAELA